jgi:hypothetical protein
MVVVPMLIPRHILRPGLNAVGEVSDPATKEFVAITGRRRTVPAIAGNDHSDIDD